MPCAHEFHLFGELPSSIHGTVRLPFKCIKCGLVEVFRCGQDVLEFEAKRRIEALQLAAAFYEEPRASP